MHYQLNMMLVLQHAGAVCTIDTTEVEQCFDLLTGA
jgi:hypothetical protein